MPGAAWNNRSATLIASCARLARSQISATRRRPSLRIACGGCRQRLLILTGLQALPEPGIDRRLERRVARHPIRLVEVIKRIRHGRRAKDAGVKPRLVIDLGAIGDHDVSVAGRDFIEDRSVVGMLGYPCMRELRLGEALVG